MKELFCLRCGYKEELNETAKISEGWMIQFNGLICPKCDKDFPHPDRKRFT